MGLPGRSSEAPEARWITLILTGVLLVQSGKGAGGAGTGSATAPLSASFARQAAASSWGCAGAGAGAGAEGGVGGCVGAGLTSGVWGRTGGRGTPWAAATMPIKDRSITAARLAAFRRAGRFGRRCTRGAAATIGIVLLLGPVKARPRRACPGRKSNGRDAKIVQLGDSFS